MQLDNVMSTVRLNSRATIQKLLIVILIGLAHVSLNAADKVLILGDTINGGTSSLEAQAAVALGFEVDIVTGTQWEAMTAAQFATYRSLILGDTGASDLSTYAAAQNTRATWGPLVNGNIIVIATDPVGHANKPGAIEVINTGIRFAANEPSKLGLYWTTSEAFEHAGNGTLVTLLDPFGTFTIHGHVDCEDDGHVVASHPAFANLDDADLFNWGCSVHSAFESWPAEFEVVAIDENLAAIYQAPDGTTGTPYILARGEGLRRTGGYLSLAIDASDNVWVSGLGRHQKIVVSGNSATPSDQYDTAGWAGHGNVIDKQGRIWSGKLNQGVVRFVDNPANRNRADFPTAFYGDYNIGLDPVTGFIWTATEKDPLFRINPSDDSALKYTYSVSGGFTFPTINGLAIDRIGNIWLANPDGKNRVAHLRTDGTLLGFVPLPCATSPIDEGPTGVAVDSFGKVWTADYKTSKAYRIDPNAGPIVFEEILPSGRRSQRLGAVDLEVDLGDGARPDNYTDMAGLVSASLRNPSGSWTVVHDAGSSVTWSRIGWTQVLAANTAVDVDVRAANSPATLVNQTYYRVPAAGATEAGAALTLSGQYLEIRATMSRLPGAAAESTPVLKDLRVSCTTTLPVLPPEDLVALAEPDSFIVNRNSQNTPLPVIKNDLLTTMAPTLAHISSVTTPASGVAQIAPDGKNILYTPKADFFGTDQFTYEVTDGQGAIGSAIVSVEVSRIDPTLQSPVAAPDSITINGNSPPTVIDVLANDCFAANMDAAECANTRGNILLLSVSQPTHGFAYITNCTQVAYVPAPYFVGTNTFTYEISNGSAEPRSATVTVIVTGDEPRIIACGDAPKTGSLTTTDTKSPGRPAYYCDTFTLSVEAGKILTLALHSPTFAPLVRVKSLSGAQVLQQSAGVGGTATTPAFAPREPTIYIVEVSSADSLTPVTGNYTLTLTCQKMWVKLGTQGLHTGDIIDFGAVTFPGTIELPVTIGNDGTTALTIQGLSTSSSIFKVRKSLSDTASTGPLADITINPGQSQIIYVSYVPSAVGVHNPPGFTLNFNAVGLPTPAFQLLLRGRANPSGTPPTVVLQNPVNDATYPGPSIIQILANAIPSAGNTIAAVEFFARRTDQNWPQTPFATINTAPYRVEWKDGNTDGVRDGDYLIVAVARDTFNRYAVSTPVLIHVRTAPAPNNPPQAVDDEISVLPDSQNNIVNVLQNDIDPDNDPLVIISARQARFGTVKYEGTHFTYTPRDGYQGEDSFIYTITDQRGERDSTASVKIIVTDPNAPTVTITSPPNNYSDQLPIAGGLQITATAEAAAGRQVTRVKFYRNDELVGEDTTATGGNQYSATWTTLRAGYHYLRAIVFDNEGRSRTSDAVRIHLQRDPNNLPPVAEITTPAPTFNATVGVDVIPRVTTDSIAVTGKAYDRDAGQNVTYQLFISDIEGNVLVQNAPVPNVSFPSTAALGSLPVSGLRNGRYNVGLIVVDAGGETDYCTCGSFLLDNETKIGHFSFSQEDLVIPVGGIPLSVIRTYNSKNEATGSFGYSWTHTIADMEIELDEIRDDVEGDDPDGELFSMRVGGGRNVTLTLPDGRRTTFRFNPQSDGFGYYLGKWESAPGVTATLEPTGGVSPGRITLFPWPHWTAGGLYTPLENFDIPGYRLTTEDGTQYIISRENLGDKSPLPGWDDGEFEVQNNMSVQVYGKPYLAEIIQPDNTRIKFVRAESGRYEPGLLTRIEHFNSALQKTRTIGFTNDNKGRIVGAHDPTAVDLNGNPYGAPTVKYEYDAEGNLARVLKLQGGSGDTAIYSVMEYKYENANYPHYITSIVDGSGIPVVVNLYDSEGRIWKVTSADQRVTEYIYNQAPTFAGATKRVVIRETLPDTSSNETIQESDARGNILLTINALGYRTERAYNTKNHLTSQTIKHPTDSTKDIMAVYDPVYFSGTDKIQFLTTKAPHAGLPEINSKIEFDNRGQPKVLSDPKNYVASGTPNFRTEHIYDTTTGDLIDTFARRSTGPTFDIRLTHNDYEVNAASPVKGYLRRTIDALNNKTDYEYYETESSFGRVGDVRSVIQRNSDNVELSRATYTYDKNGNRLTETRRRSMPGANQQGCDPGYDCITTTYTYDRQNRAITTTDAAGGATVNTFDINGRLESTRDRYFNTTRFTYNAQGELIQTEHPDGTISRTATKYVNKQKEIISQQPHHPFEAALGTRIIYDELGRTIKSESLENVVIDLSSVNGVHSTVFQGATVVSFTTTHYDYAGRVEYTIDARGNRTTFLYDGNSRRSRVITAASGKETHTVFDYDLNGNQTAVHLEVRDIPTGGNPNPPFTVLATTGYQYDDFNRRKQTDFPDTTSQKMFYDDLGRVVEEEDQANVIKRFNYDGLGRLIGVLMPYARTGPQPADQTFTGYSYDEVGNLIAVTNANEMAKLPGGSPLPTKFEYDKLGRRTKRVLPVSPNGHVETWAYDTSRNRVTHTDLNQRITVTEFDSRGRLLARAPQVSPTAPPDPAFPPEARVPVSFTYTGTGKRETMSDASGLTAYQYDNRDRLWKKITPFGTLTYSYDANGNLTRIQSSNPQGTDTTYEWDEINRLKSVVPETASPTVKTTYAYDGYGNLESFTHPNTLKTTYHYNTLNRLTHMEVEHGTGPTPTLLASYNYNPAGRTLGPAGNRRGVREVIRQSNQNLINRDVDYEYDQLYRLIEERILVGTPSGNITYDNAAGYSDPAGFGYDRVGNRRSRTVSTSALQTAGVSQYNGHTFNANDRLGTEQYDDNGNVLTGDASFGQTANDIYDFENRLIRRTTSTKTIEIVYDGDGNRVKKTVNGQTTFYLVDQLNPSGFVQVLEEFQNNSSTPPPEGSRILMRLYTHGHDLLSQKLRNSSIFELSYYGYDGHGSVRQLIAPSGAVTDSYSYDAFGIQITTDGTTLNNYRYAGEQFDEDLRLYYNRARYLNPNSGRFWSMDTFEGRNSDPFSLHKYLYAHANPINMIDPSGNESLVSVNFSMALVFQLTMHELRGANAILKGARALFGGDDDLNSLIHGLDIINIVDEKVGTVLLGAGAVAGGFKVLNLFKNFLTSGTAKRLAEKTLLTLQKLRPAASDACFVAGTPIATEDGSIPIEFIKPGDRVVSWDERNQTFTVGTVTTTTERVADELTEINLAGFNITSTPEHPFWVEGFGWTPAQNLQFGDLLLSPNGEALVVLQATNFPARVPVFNFEVENTHTYTVGDVPVVVHNICPWGQRAASLPQGAPGVYVIRTPTGETYVGQAQDLADRLTRANHSHADLIRDPANQVFTIQVDLTNWKGTTVDAIDVVEEFFIRALGAKWSSSNPAGLNRRFEMNSTDFENLIKTLGFPDMLPPVGH